MKLPRTIRLDSSDLRVFEIAADPGEWAVTGSFVFASADPEALSAGERIAFRSGWLGLESFGFSSLVEVGELDEASYFAMVERLAAHFVDRYGAPDLVSALSVAREEIDYASGLAAEHKVHTLLLLEREPGSEGVIERIRVVHPSRAEDHARIWDIAEDDSED